MQLYSGLPIITNKIPESERNHIPHHLLGCIQLDEPTWTVSNFVASALEKIAEIRRRGRLPVLVGGTHYYTQSLLFHDALTTETPVEPEAAPETATVDSATTWPILDRPTPEILAKLSEVDPVMAQRWHPNDRRKIRRSLEIYLQTGRRASEIYAEQRLRRTPNRDATKDDDSAEDESTTAPTSALRTDTLILWTHTSPPALRTRLDSRVDKMMQAGLLGEVDTLAAHAERVAAQARPIDPSTGIWVAIGYKEFLAYRRQRLAAAAAQRDEAGPFEPHAASSPSETPALTTALAAAVERTKISTRQYAKRQTRWLRLKLLPAVRGADAAHQFFVLDSSLASDSAAAYQATVAGPGLDIVGRWLRGETLPDPGALGPLARETLKEDGVGGGADGGGDGNGETGAEGMHRRVCEACGTVVVTQRDWDQHVASRKHRRLLAKRRQYERRGREGEGAERGGGEKAEIEVESGSIGGSAAGDGDGDGDGRAESQQ